MGYHHLAFASRGSVDLGRVMAPRGWLSTWSANRSHAGLDLVLDGLRSRV